MRIQLAHPYEDIISIENLLGAWEEFVKGKRKRQDVQVFEMYLMDNILSLHEDLERGTYRHGSYEAFNISDPKPRNIHKATVRDRLLHHALYRVLYPFFNRTFISDSYSCRVGKGVHKALKRFESFGRKASQNNTKICYVLKCDIRKFFASIDHDILISILKTYIPDKDIIALLTEIIESFVSPHSTLFERRGLPLGNLTSQLLVNIYMNEFDQFMKHTLKQKYYIRYADDFCVFHEDKVELLSLLRRVTIFLRKNLNLELHPNKVFLKTLASGVDFLGWVHFPDHRVLRTATKRRVLKALKESEESATLQSYRGLLKHGNAWRMRKEIERMIEALH